ncbi:hypothetical protein PV726_32445 [Streptomyces europaeiscabiei]|uniref:hypothetical protein n=1 Tax=Streptomyces europaeiscabiei TaxID=146819 RepID=UPI0029B6E0A5|nr:hypothetical protein [Streptomyces europaeiscabiei]MDX3694968.1 hypothetical protein [Streptomyces europaeiscabiei]
MFRDRVAIVRFRPSITGHDTELTVELVAEVSLHFRIPLTFVAYFHCPDGSHWELRDFHGKQAEHLVSVRAVRDLVAEHVVSVRDEHPRELQAVIAAGREVAAARVLQHVLQARADRAAADTAEQQALTSLSALGITEERAALVSGQLRELSRLPFAL